MVDSQYFRRYGSKRELIVRHLLEWGVCVETAELMEKFGSKTARPGRFFQTWIRPMVEDGVLRGDAGSVELAPGWREALEAVRARTDEDEDNRRQSEKYARQRRDRRARFAGEARGEISRPEPVPELAGPERVAEIFTADAERDHAARVEEQRRKAGTTAAVFLSDEMASASAVRWRELRERWIMRGSRGGDLRAAVVAGPFGFRREPGDEDHLYVYAPKKAPAFAPPESGDNPRGNGESAVLAMPKRAKESGRGNLTKPDIAGAPENLRKPEIGERLDPFRNNPQRKAAATLTFTNNPDGPRKLPPKMGGVYRHGPECACWICEDEAPAERVEVGASA